MPHPVCFFGQYPASSANTPLSPASVFYPGFSSGQNRGFPFQIPQESSSPNYVQSNTVQFLPRFNYVASLSQPTGQGVGPIGPTISNAPNAPIFPLNQQPTGMSQQPVANMPYFCGYLSLPTIRFPPIPGTSESDRSVDETKDLPKESRQRFPEDDVNTQTGPRERNIYRLFARILLYYVVCHFSFLTFLILSVLNILSIIFSFLFQRYKCKIEIYEMTFSRKIN